MPGLAEFLSTGRGGPGLKCLGKAGRMSQRGSGQFGSGPQPNLHSRLLVRKPSSNGSHGTSSRQTSRSAHTRGRPAAPALCSPLHPVPTFRGIHVCLVPKEPGGGVRVLQGHILSTQQCAPQNHPSQTFAECVGSLASQHIYACCLWPQRP